MGESASEWIEVASGENPRSRAARQEVTCTMGREKLRLRRSMPSVPQTDTGRRVENTKANGRTSAKELGKIDP